MRRKPQSKSLASDIPAFPDIGLATQQVLQYRKLSWSMTSWDFRNDEYKTDNRRKFIRKKIF